MTIIVTIVVVVLGLGYVLYKWLDDMRPKF